ncbi:leucine-rich repeat flightless-interacting protein 1 isoform X3 [Engraulis encrasicolus]|uniref:leucine-rich repeat flightless-interacting protein 1 isoform X3 n=1 Tax=Engraulis encrasicolus TaxID=184585 RepID=UPI002FD4DD8D
MGTQGPGRKRIPNKGLTAEEDALNVIAREAEARLAAKRAARAEAREIRMKELERQQKEIYQVQKKYYGLDNNKDSKWGDIEQWMEDSERYSRPARKQTSLSDDEERMSVSSRGSVRSDLDAVGAYGGLGSELGSTSSHSHKKSKKKKKKHSKTSNGCDDDYSMLSGWSSKLSDDSRVARSKLSDESRVSRSKLSDESWAPRSKLSDESRVSRSKLSDESWTPRSKLSDESRVSRSKLSDESWASRSSRLDLQPGSLYDESLCSSSSTRRLVAREIQSEYLAATSSSRASSRANSARTSPVEDCGGSVASFLRSAASTRDLDDITIPDLASVDDRLDRDYLEKGSRASTLSSATLASLGGSSSRRGSGDTSITADTENSVREIKEIHELKDQIQDVESKYLQSLKEVKDALAEMEEKYRKAMVSNAQLDNEKCNLMYQVDVQKDSLTELEELLSESRREYEDKTKELEREKHAHSILQFQFSELKQTLKASEELLTEIRQLNLQHDGFRREVADLQETLEWKDKKIGALERQKEYTDAIRNERDELRDEVVQLKDILKKHGIVLGPDLNPNGEIGEGMLDGTGDAKTSPTEGTSVLGSGQEKQSGVAKAAERLQPNQLDEAVSPQNHVTSSPPPTSGPPTGIGLEARQSKEPDAPPIGDEEEIESGPPVQTQSIESHSGREGDQSSEVAGSDIEGYKSVEGGKEMRSPVSVGLDISAERQVDQKVEEVCATEPVADITSENGTFAGEAEDKSSVPEIIVSVVTSEQSEEASSEIASENAGDGSSTVAAAEQEAPSKAKTEAETTPVSEEEEETAASQTPAKSQQPQTASASGKKKKKKKKKNKQKQKGGAQSEVKQDDTKESKTKGESSESEDPGQKTKDDKVNKSLAESEVQQDQDTKPREDPVQMMEDPEQKIEEKLVREDGETEKDAASTEFVAQSNADEQTVEPIQECAENCTVQSDAPEITTEVQNDTTDQSNAVEQENTDASLSTPEFATTDQSNADEQENTDVSLNTSESATNASESCSGQQAEVDDLPSETLQNAQPPPTDPDSHPSELQLNGEHRSVGGADVPEVDQLDGCTNNEVAEGSCSALLIDSPGASCQLGVSESAETSQTDVLSSHAEEDGEIAEGTTTDMAGNGTETEPEDEPEVAATDECMQVEDRSSQLLSSVDGEREGEVANQNQAAAPALSDDEGIENLSEADEETNNDIPESRPVDAGGDEEDDEGEEFLFDDQGQGNNGSPEQGKPQQERLVEGETDQSQHQEGAADPIKEEQSDEAQEGSKVTVVEQEEENGTGEGVQEHRTEEATQGDSPASELDHSQTKDTEQQPSDSSTEVKPEAVGKEEVASSTKGQTGSVEDVGQSAGVVEAGDQGAPARKDSKKGGKKKGKEECKMS